MMKKNIDSLAVIGLGTQGAQIAFRSALYGKRVVACDVSEAVLETAMGKINGWLEEYRQAGRIGDSDIPEILTRITCSTDMDSGVKGVDLVLEVVPERLELKQKVWEQIDRAADPDTLLTTNSSSLKSSDIGKNINRKALSFNLNFMTPVKDDLVEVMWNANTDDAIKPVVLDFLYALNLVPIVTQKEIKGFSHNRVWRAIKKETLKLWDQGYCDYQDLDRAFMMEFGTSFGPFGLMDIVGLDVIRDIENSYYQDSGDESDKPPKKLLEYIEQGKLGVKSGCGFYEYPNPAYTSSDWLRKRK